MTYKLALSIIIITLVSSATYLLLPPHRAPSPLADTTQKTTAEPKYLIMGFAPYWLIKKITPQALSGITHFTYFALMLDTNGNLVTHLNPREQEPGYTGYLKLLNNPPLSPLILTFVPRSQEALDSLISTRASRTKAVSTIIKELNKSKATGVNIDFEPLGNTPNELRDHFTSFIRELNQGLKTTPSSLLSISIYPSAAVRPRLWDLKALSPLVNHFVVMSYDYTLPGEAKAGPNSPLRGAEIFFANDIVTNLSELSRYLPPRQIILGIPFYGYEWEVDSTGKYAPTYSRAAVASLERIDELTRDNVLELLWDRNSLTPYAIRRKGGKVVSQIYYENSTSIRLKLDLVRSAGLGGVAIWALGYEGEAKDLWHTLDSLPR